MDAYAVGVKLALADNAAQVLGPIFSQLLGVHTEAGKVEKAFGSLQKAIGAAFAIGAAGALLGVMEKMIKAGADLENQLYRLPDRRLHSEGASGGTGQLVEGRGHVPEPHRIRDDEAHRRNHRGLR